MENQKSNSSLKAIIIVLSILLVGSLVFIYRMSTESKETERQYMSEKDKLINDLQAAKTSYDEAIAENSSLKGDLEAERAKIEQLLEEVKKSDGEKAALEKFKNNYYKLKREMDSLLAENRQLKSQNAALTSQRDSTQTALNESKRFNDTLVSQNENLSRTVEKASKLTILNLRTESFKERNSGKLVSTEKARRVDKLKISFTIAANEVAKAGERVYYVQVIDGRNNVLGDKKTEVFGDYTLTYSFITRPSFQGKTVEVSQMLEGSDFAKGTYFVNVFDKGQLVANSSFQLK